MLIYGAGFFSILILVCALVVDIGMFEQTKCQMQAAADAAAIGAVFAVQDGQTVVTSGKQEAALNGSTDGVNGVTVNIATPPTSGAYSGNKYAVQATITKPVSAHFLSKTVTLAVQATAMRVPTPCVYFLSTVTTEQSFQVINQTNTASCPMYMGNSYRFQGVTTSGNGQYFVAGSPSLSLGTTTPAAYFGSPTLADPLAYITAPVPASTCTYTNVNIGSGSATLNPGTFCGGLTLTTTGTITLNPGVYIISGVLNINGPTLNGTGVTFYVTQGSNTGSGPNIISNVNANLSPPTSGATQGLLYFSSRTLPAGQATLQMYYWNPASIVDGIFYLVNQQFNCVSIPLTPKKYLGVVADYGVMNNVGFSPAADYSTLANGNPFRPLGAGGGGLVE